MSDLGQILARVERGQKFNVYDLTSGGYVIGIGPISDCLGLATAESAAAANLIVDALRANNSQPPAASPVGESQ